MSDVAALAGALKRGGRRFMVERVQLLDAWGVETFARAVWLATRMVGVPVALAVLVDADGQFFKSQVGMPEPWASLRDHAVTEGVVLRHRAPSRRAVLLARPRAFFYRQNARMDAR